MGKKRVHEIAKDLDLNSKDIISALTGLGVEVKSHMSTVETGEIDKLYQTLGKAPGNRPTPAKT
ncbi:MAG: translation initiation factor IF-2 N-terminal domain-containing protein, partial [Eubacteriales bacterium]|nr:translation initiation factor IF-2 N-terminal domain-containing protein [Eubacteriales bacterium]